MNRLIRVGRWYWHVNAIVWQKLRRFAVPLLILFGALSAVAWVVGVMTGNPLLLWMPAVYAYAWAIVIFLKMTGR